MTKSITPEIVWLGDHECSDPTIAGGKAANLSRLYHRFRIPPGFCVTADAILRLSRMNFGERTDTQSTAGPLAAHIGEAYRKLSDMFGEAESAVSIRSSATSEDSKSTSFAGQYKTVLNVVGIQALLKAIEDCVSSASRPDLNSYRRQFRDDDTGIAILIQKFVDSEASCVLFTANPVTQDRREIIINSNWGLGESIVSGIVTPDSFVIEKRSLRIIRRDIAKKLVRTVPFREGVHEVEMPSELQTRPSLSEQQLLDVSRLGVSLEQFMEWPADIECSFAEDGLYLLQCRPITSLLRGAE